MGDPGQVPFSLARRSTDFDQQGRTQVERRLSAGRHKTRGRCLGAESSGKARGTPVGLVGNGPGRFERLRYLLPETR